MRQPDRLASVVALALAAACGPARSSAQRAGHAVPDTTDRNVTAAVNAAMNGMDKMDMTGDPHMFMTKSRPANQTDSARAARLVTEIRTDLAKYKDVRVAESDGFKQFLPNVPQPVYHFTNWRWALAEAFRFDPSKPTSLLYRRNRDGTFTLLGAMYTEPRSASESALDNRVPLSVAAWHEHVNWCLPKPGDARRWRDSTGGKPVFGPRSSIATATASACEAVGGRFLPHVFGWMVHANVFASDDPAVIWGHTM